MKIVSVILILLVIAGAAVYIDGSHISASHTVSVTGVVNAPPEKVWSLITNVEKVPDWRRSVKAVTMLQQDSGRDHWVEHLAHGRFMTFLAVRSEPPVRRDVQSDDPKAPYGGVWTYELSPGSSPSTTNLRITETGYINPPIYRFFMARVVGLTRNLNLYLKDIQTAAAKS